MRIILKWVSVLLVPITVTAAAYLTAADSGNETRTHVVAALDPIAEVARRVGGREVAVTGLTPAGAEPHELELQAGQLAALEDADVVLVLGRGFQPAVEKAAARRRGAVTVLDEIESRAGRDAHVWLDPVLMGRVVDVVEEALTQAHPPGAAGFSSRASQLRTELADLDRRYRDGLRACERREIVTAHAAFGSLAARYGLTERAIAGIEPDAEPSPSRVATLVDRVRRTGTTTVFTERLVSPKVAEALAREAGVRTDVLDPVESLPGGGRGSGYRTVMLDNLRRLRQALECA